MRMLPCAAIVFVTASACAFAQLATTTSLVGNVTDSAGAAIAGSQHHGSEYRHDRHL